MKTHSLWRRCRAALTILGVPGLALLWLMLWAAPAAAASPGWWNDGSDQARMIQVGVVVVLVGTYFLMRGHR